MTRLLLTAFGPFGPFKVNPSQELLRACGLPHKELTVSYQFVGEFLGSLDGRSFDALVLVGVHGRARKLRWESTGHNVIGAKEDLGGVVPEGKISQNGSPKLHSTLKPARALPQGAIRTRNAGDYLCNFSLYSALQRFPEKKVAFIHIPPAERLSISDQKPIFMGIIDALLPEGYETVDPSKLRAN
ncbi:MAG: hypothetical protein JSS72_05320 [Armatimonadetes bacterium]|nr:hypothetical protein [Armatimonadota bacterium]